MVLQTPSPDYIKEEELDVQLLPPDEVKLVITDRAAQVRTRSRFCETEYPLWAQSNSDQ